MCSVIESGSSGYPVARAWSKRDALRNGIDRSGPREMGSKTLEGSMSPKAWGTALILIIRCGGGAVGVEEALQNQHGSDLIDDLAVVGGRAAGGVEMAVSLG